MFAPRWRYAAQHGAWAHSMEDRSQHGTRQLWQRRCVLHDHKLAVMTSMSADAGLARPQRLLLIPVGQENTHQQTIDSLLPTGVEPSASTSALLPCWAVTDGNYLVKNKVRAQAGDIFALIRAQHKGQRAYVHRLAVVETLVRDPSACDELYKVSHDYNMGGRKVTSVPFTWIIKFKSVAPVKWDKQTFLEKLGIPAHDPILSARPAVLAHQKNAAQAVQVLQECNAVLGLPSSLPESLSSSHLPPASLLPSNSYGPNSHKGVPPIPNSNSKTAHRLKSFPKRSQSELHGSGLRAEQQLPAKKKCTSLHASTYQSVDEQDQAPTDSQTGQPHEDILQSKQHSEHTNNASSHHRPCMVMSKHTELQHLSTEELQMSLGRLKRLSQYGVNSLPDRGQKLMARSQQLQDELHSRMARVQSKQQSLCTREHNMSADPSSKMTAPVAAELGDVGNNQDDNQMDSNAERAPVQDSVMLEPQSEAQLRSPLTSQGLSVHLDVAEAVDVFSDDIQVEASPDVAPVRGSETAGTSAAIAGTSAALAVSPPAAYTMNAAQQSMLAGLIYHFAATKGPSWLFG